MPAYLAHSLQRETFDMLYEPLEDTCAVKFDGQSCFGCLARAHHLLADSGDSVRKHIVGAISQSTKVMFECFKPRDGGVDAADVSASGKKVRTLTV
jgi:hypothetical protein